MRPLLGVVVAACPPLICLPTHQLSFTSCPPTKRSTPHDITHPAIRRRFPFDAAPWRQEIGPHRFPHIFPHIFEHFSEVGGKLRISMDCPRFLGNFQKMRGFYKISIEISEIPDFYEIFSDCRENPENRRKHGQKSSKFGVQKHHTRGRKWLRNTLPRFFFCFFKKSGNRRGRYMGIWRELGTKKTCDHFCDITQSFPASGVMFLYSKFWWFLSMFSAIFRIFSTIAENLIEIRNFWNFYGNLVKSTHFLEISQKSWTIHWNPQFSANFWEMLENMGKNVWKSVNSSDPPIFYFLFNLFWKIYFKKKYTCVYIYIHACAFVYIIYICIYVYIFFLNIFLNLYFKKKYTQRNTRVFGTVYKM